MSERGSERGREGMKEGGREYRSHSRLDSLDSRTDSLADFAQHFDENLQIDRFYPLLFLFFLNGNFMGCGEETLRER